MHEIVQKVVADIEKKTRAQVDDKPIAQRTVGQSVKQSWNCSQIEDEEEGEDDRQKKDQMERQWIEDEKLEENLERRKAEGVSLQTEVLQKVPELVVHERMSRCKKIERHRRKEESQRMVHGGDYE